MNATLNRRRALALAAAGFATGPLAAFGQAYPSKPVRIVVSYPAGGVSDAVARAIADKLTAQLGQPVVVENKAGASGAIGLDAVAKSAPDGHTLGFSAISPLALSPHLGKLPFDPARDIVPLASVMYSPVVLLATSATPARDLRELLAAARARPGSVRWATAGTASLGHIMLEQLKAAAKVDITHVPYKGGGQQVTDALSGQFEIISTNAAPAVMAHVKAGKLRPLAVGAPERLDTLPQVPTLAELGLPASNLVSLFGFFLPANVPAPIQQRLNAEINKVLQLPDIRSRLVNSDNVPTGGTAAEFAQRIRTESENNARIVQAAGIRAD